MFGIAFCNRQTGPEMGESLTEMGITNGAGGIDTGIIVIQNETTVTKHGYLLCDETIDERFLRQ